ncbi:hypothetical protein [Selenomonas ruminantium]
MRYSLDAFGFDLSAITRDMLFTPQIAPFTP